MDQIGSRGHAAAVLGDEAGRLASVLVVDDDPFMRATMEHVLFQLGYHRTATVASGRAALDRVLASRDSIDIIILDLRMPDMDGVEFIRQLAHHNFRGGVAVVSGADDRVLEAVSRLIGNLRMKSLGRLPKPFRVDQLRALLETEVAPDNAPTALTGYQYPWTVGDLELAVTEQQLLLHYQPLVALSTGKMLGVEGLIRWLHPIHGLIPPNQFIPIAEETGLIRQITEFVLTEGMRQSNAWSATGCKLNVALNVAIRDLSALDFPDLASSIAARAGVDPAAVTLEVSEHEVVKQLHTALDVLSRLKLKGFRLAIDDFGTGYSSLAQLRDLPFDELKIDRGFVHKSPTDAKRRSICHASIRLAHDLEMKVVAEGIESDEELKLVQELGVEIGQGYVIARPMAAEMIPGWFATAAQLQRWRLDQPSNIASARPLPPRIAAEDEEARLTP